MLTKVIEKKRDELIKTVNLYGLSSEQALAMSRELDELIDRYQDYKKHSVPSVPLLLQDIG